MTIENVNLLSCREFVETVGPVFEHSPWVAERAWASRPFRHLTDLHETMTRQVLEASPEEQLALLCAHPDLGARARMSEASTAEQTGAGLDQLRPEEFRRLQSANAAFRRKFGFPFLFAVKGATKFDILRSIEQRLGSTLEVEFQTALEQVFRIVGFRLQDLVQEK